MKLTYLFKLLFMIALVEAATFEAFAYDFAVDGIYYNIYNGDSTVYVTCNNQRYNSYSGAVTIPEIVIYNNKTYSVTSIGESAFYSCPGLTSVTLPNSITSIGNQAFRSCTGLTSVTLPNSVTSIEGYAFYGCTGLTSVTLPNSINSIKLFTFYNCRKLRRITIPYPVTSIEGSAFYYCEDLTDVTSLAVTPPSMGAYNTIYPGYYMATLHVPEKSVEAYKATECWSHFINIVGDASDDNSTPADAPINKCDTNDDGEVNIADVNRVIDAILSH